MATKRRKILISVLVAVMLAVGGFVASLFLVPSEDTINRLIQQDETQQTVPGTQPDIGADTLESAKEQYLAQLESGTITFAQVEIYSQSLIAANQPEEAVKIWGDYVEKNPEDVAGWKRYGNLSQATKAEEQYLIALQNIARLEPTTENLAALANYQNYRKDYTGQVETLKKLVAMTNETEPKYLLDLADIALLVEDKEAALAALSSYYTKHAARLDEQASAANQPEQPNTTEATPDNAADSAAPQGEQAGATPPPPPPLPEGVELEATPAEQAAQPAAADAPQDQVAGNEEVAGAPQQEGAQDNTQDMANALGAAENNEAAMSAEAPAQNSPNQPADTAANNANKGADYSRLPTYISLLANAERDADALEQAITHTKSGGGVAFRPAVAEVLLADVGASAAVEYVEAVSAQEEVPEELRAVYARALVQQGKYETALPVLKSLSDRGGDYSEWYFLALSGAAKKDKEARRDLVTYVRGSFESGELTEAQKIDRVYALLNAGEKSRALDYTERSMHATDDADAKAKWRDLHKALTYKPKPVRVARVVPTVSLDQKLALARQPGATEDYIRRTAFELLAAKRKDDAVELFSVLAAVNGPTSRDANQLIYLWGARIAGPELGWIVNQAAKASPQDQAAWVSIIANHAAAEDIVAIAQTYPNWLTHPEYERRYIAALMESGNPDAVNQYIASQASGAHTAETYQAIASRAESVMDMRTAEQALRQAATADPTNRETWLRLTSMYTSRARYSAAEQTVANALHADSSYVTSQIQAARQDLSANYYAAVLAKREGDDETANQYFNKVVSIGKSTMLDDRDSQVKYLSSLMALGYEQEASQGFENILAAYPGDAVLLADYMSALLDRGSYLQALDVASRHGNDVTMDSAAAMDDPAPLLIRSPNARPPLLQSMSNGRELKLIFDGPIPNDYVLYANQQAPSWVAYTSTSYDTAVVAAHTGYSLQAVETPNGLMVSAVPAPDASSAEAIRQRYLRLQLLYARLELETDAIDKALERLQSLAPIYQEYPEYRAYQGNAEYYAGNLTRGLNLVKRAQDGDPGNEDIRYLRRNIERFRGEHVKLDQEYRRLGESDMHVTTLEARKQFANSIDVTARYQSNFFDTDVIQRSYGGLDSVNGYRWQGEFSLAKFMEDSSIAEASIYVNRAEIGGGLAYQFVNPLGTTNVYAQYRKPYWDFIEAVVEDATRDRAGAWHLWRPNPKWTIRGEAAYNRYHIEEKSNIAEAAAVQGLVLRTLNNKQPYIALAYGLDAEYFLGDVDRNAAGANNKLLPFRSREIHSLSGIFYHDFSEDTNGELSLGYAVDRLGEHGPAVEGRIHHYVTEEVEMQLRARYGLEAGNTDNDALSVGGYVRWTW